MRTPLRIDNSGLVLGLAVAAAYFFLGAALPLALGTGLLVTEMMGQGVNAVTGDYSRGAAGFWVENGEIGRPVHEITVAGNLREMFLGIAALGDDIDRRGAIRCGSLLIDEMTVAGD